MFGSKMSKIERAIEKKDARKLIALADSRDKDIYIAAITGLGKVGGDDAANYLTTLIQNTAEPDTRIAVARALGMIGDMHTKAFLSAQLGKETEPAVRESHQYGNGGHSRIISPYDPVR